MKKNNKAAIINNETVIFLLFKMFCCFHKSIEQKQIKNNIKGMLRKSALPTKDNANIIANLRLLFTIVLLRYINKIPR